MGNAESLSRNIQNVLVRLVSKITSTVRNIAHLS